MNLKNGNIPSKTECPFKHKCQFVEVEACSHKGIEHEIEFSCASARAFDLIENIRSKKIKTNTEIK